MRPSAILRAIFGPLILPKSSDYLISVCCVTILNEMPWEAAKQCNCWFQLAAILAALCALELDTQWSWCVLRVMLHRVLLTGIDSGTGSKTTTTTTITTKTKNASVLENGIGTALPEKELQTRDYRSCRDSLDVLEAVSQ